ncbi:hypothetical protein FO519_008034 [Halicephalobus sp. NKZ332]|nr:hypothetical protein FO519_008034 [Halicephalobus sp. NKZ332]
MGNVQTAPIPRVIPSVESYFQEIPEIKYVQNLGNTRFMKVAKVEHADGPMVAKVFIFPDNFIIDRFAQVIVNIRKKVAHSNYSNCLGFSKTYKTEKFAILYRPFHKDTLHDRLSIRPFLTDAEKRWIAFQLLKALEQCRREGVCHGDIKSHNILVSSSLWVNLTDFASFKPTFVPCDTPSAFTFFFNASRSNGCNIAPERFKKSVDFDLFNTDVPENLPDLTLGKTDAMDIFSIGCVLVELFTDGRRSAFSFGQLIDYLSMDDETAKEYVNTVISDVPDAFKKLISIMLEKNPETRRELYDSYAPFRADNLFPPIFESFLYHYMGEFRIKKEDKSQQIVPKNPDDVITKLYVEKERFIPELKKDQLNSVLLLISLITSNIRACKSINSKMDAICLLKELSKITPEALVAERIVPYLVKLLSDQFVFVQTEAIHVLTEITSDFKEIPTEETRLFVDYIFPKMREILQDQSSSPMVIMAVASNLGTLALTSLKFLEEGLKHAEDEGGLIGPTVDNPGNKESAPVSKLPQLEKKSLTSIISEFYTQLITRDNNAVRQTIMEGKNLDKLCLFFEKIGTETHNILMHMITVLNDKNDWRLMSSFFKNCPVVARRNPKTRNSEFFYPLLQQGLQSTEEFVILESLRCIYSLCSENRLEKATIWELCKDFVQFIVHPNVWLRIATVDILKVLDEIFPFADVYCRLMPYVKPFLKENLVRLNDKAAIHECLSEPIPRQAWKLVFDCKHPQELFKELEGRRTLNKLGGGRHALFPASPIESTKNSSKMANQVESTLRLLNNYSNADDRTISLEEKILAFAPNLLKRLPLKKKEKVKSDYYILEKVDPKVMKIYDLDRGIHVGEGKAGWKSGIEIPGEIGTEIFENDLSSGLKNISNSAATVLSDGSTGLTSKCLLEELLDHKRERYLQQKKVDLQGRIITGAAAFSVHGREMGGNNFGKPEIKFVAHLHEHSEKITKLVVHADQTVFATSSLDRTVKLWSLNQIKNKQPSAIVSVSTIPHPHPINSCQFMTDNNDHLVTASEGGVLSIYDIEKKRFLSQTVTVDQEMEGGFTKVSTMNHLIFGLTAQSSVFCFDKRSPNSNRNFAHGLETVFHRKARNSYGFITSMTIDPVNQHWMVLTSSAVGSNSMILYDLRFLGLEIAAWEHPNQKTLVLNSWPILNQNESSECTQLATGVSKEGEISIWNLNIGQCERSHVLWSGGNGSGNTSQFKGNLSDDVLNYEHELQTSAMVQSLNLDGIFTGDSHGSLRFWSLRQPQRCNYLSGPYRPHLTPPLVTRQCSATPSMDPLTPPILYRRVDNVNGVTVIKEDRPKTSGNLSFPFGDRDYERLMPVGEQHRDVITDLGLMGDEYLTSAGRDGVVKVWKIFNS